MPRFEAARDQESEEVGLPLTDSTKITLN